jgi:hypothetical protein
MHNVLTFNQISGIPKTELRFVYNRCDKPVYVEERVNHWKRCWDGDGKMSPVTGVNDWGGVDERL